MAKSPLMKQYEEIKGNHKDAILFCRIGDFYEMFYEDAITASRELELVLTGKQCGEKERAPMCGVPYHAAQNYIAKLVDRGYKVAICEQTEDPATAKGLVRREVVQVITPGTLVSSLMLDEKENNFLASCYYDGENWGLAYGDISTGELAVTYITGKFSDQLLINQLIKLDSKELLLSSNESDEIREEDFKDIGSSHLETFIENPNSLKKLDQLLVTRFPEGMKAKGLEDKRADSYALAILLRYVQYNLKSDLSHLRKINSYLIGSQMALDRATIRNLELTESLYEKNSAFSLLRLLDKCGTAMGSRKLKQWLREPLNDVSDINERLDAVEILFGDILLLNNLREQLKGIYDLQRLIGRIAMETANGRDLLALLKSITHLPDIRWELMSQKNQLLRKLADGIDPMEEVSQLIDKAISEDCPINITEGELIKEGYSEDLDNLKDSAKDGRNWIASLEASERERTGIKNLKVGYNKVFGYYLEITKSNYHLIPEDYIRKQTLVNSERFITPKLKEMESVVLGAEVKINSLEHEIFCQIRNYIKSYTEILQETAEAISTLDVLSSFAQVSNEENYVKPYVDDSYQIDIKNGRHPVIEKTVKDGLFVPNDCKLDRDENILLLITGPNMSGKSTYMRQLALIVLMAQTGCFVPAEKASIGVCDRIFTRIGASDNLAMGQSTFFVEMSELSYILHNMTGKSLLLLDEIGRGTSTYDGLSLAWALAEHILKSDLKARTLFATHYHEMTELEGNLPGFRNLNVEVKEEDGKIIFLHSIAAGPSSRSYGIHVAQLAGVPESLLERAEEKLAQLESREKCKND